MKRRADPYRDTQVIDARAPRVNQTVVGVVALVAVLTGWWALLALLALQLALGLTLGRRWCLACVFYYEVLQPRFGEGPLEDSRPPRFANMIGLGFLSAASLAYLVGWTTLGAVLGGIVAALALLAAMTGFCAGCTAFKLGYVVTGRSVRRLPAAAAAERRLDRPDPTPAGFRQPRHLFPPMRDRPAGTMVAAPGGEDGDEPHSDGCRSRTPRAGGGRSARRPAAAEIDGPCTASIAGTNVKDLGATSASDAIKVKEDAQIPVTMSSSQEIDHLTVTVSLAGLSYDAKDGPANGTSWTRTVDVEDYAKWGVGLYQVTGSSSGPGLCLLRASALVQVEGNPLSKPAGWAAVGLTVLGALGLVGVAISGAARRRAASRGRSSGCWPGSPPRSA